MIGGWRQAYYPLGSFLLRQVNNVSLDKKSVVQIVILLALVGGAGVVYLTSQEGGLNLSFITDLLPGAGDNKTEPPAPSKTSAASTASSQPQPPPIPAQPAKGQVGGSPFEPDSVVLAPTRRWLPSTACCKAR